MDILKDRVKPLYFKYLVAASGSAMVASIFGMIDAMMVGKYHGPSGNAAIAIFTPVWSFVYSLGILSGIGGSVLFANKRGSGNEKSAQEHFKQAVPSRNFYPPWGHLRKGRCRGKVVRQ